MSMFTVPIVRWGLYYRHTKTGLQAVPSAPQAIPGSLAEQAGGYAQMDASLSSIFN
jgi:hypothetical protein